MDENTRRQITWVLIISAILCLIIIASYRRNEMKRLQTMIAEGRPAERIEAVRTLVRKQKLKEALEDQPRWVQENAVAAVPLVGSNDAYYELLGCNAVLDAPVQTRAQTVLARLGRRGVEVYIEALQDKDATTASTAKTPLITIGKAIEAEKDAQRNEVIDGCKTLLDAWDQPVRDAVRDILAGIASERVCNVLIPIMQQTEPGTKRLKTGKVREQTSQEYLRARSTAQAALVAMQVPAIKPIIDNLLTFRAPEVRGIACKMLGDIGAAVLSTKAEEIAIMVPPLLDRLNNDEQWAVRRRAANALGLLGDVAKSNGAVPHLIARLNDSSMDVKAASAEALGRLGDPAAIGPLVRTLVTNRFGATNELRIALTALGAPAIAQMAPALNHPEEEVRLIATRATAEIGGPEAVVPLAARLQDSSVEIRRVAADALRAIADERVLAQVAAALSDPDWQVYHAARDALANVGLPAVPFLVRALATENPRVASMAEQALVMIGAPALSVLQANLSSDSETQAHWAAIALGDIGPDALHYALAVLNDRSRPVRARAKAAMALGRTGAGDAVEPLMAALREQEPPVQVQAIWALSRLADERATPALVAALASKSWEVRDAAMDVLRDWRMPKVTDELAKIAASGDVDTKRRAMIAIAELTSVAAHELLEQEGAMLASGTEGQAKVDVGVLEQAALDARQSDKVRRRALHALGYVGGESTLNALTPLLSPGNPLAGPAAIAIARIGSRTMVKPAEGQRPKLTAAGKKLIDLLLSTPDEDLRIKTALALSIMGEQPVWELMNRMLKVPTSMRPWIAATLGAIGKAATDPVLEVRGASRDPELKQWLAVTLQLIGDAQALDLLKHLPDSDKPTPDRLRPSQAILARIRAAKIE